MPDMMVYKQAYDAAIANKVEVKNPELIFAEVPLLDNHTKDGDTFPLPDGIEVDIWYMAGKKCEMAFLKRIEPEEESIFKIMTARCNAYHEEVTKLKEDNEHNVNRALEIAAERDVLFEENKKLKEKPDVDIRFSSDSKYLPVKEPEETQEDLYQLIRDAVFDDFKSGEYDFFEYMSKNFTIQRKKS